MNNLLSPTQKLTYSMMPNLKIPIHVTSLLYFAKLILVTPTYAIASVILVWEYETGLGVCPIARPLSLF